jgi:hypothetical protein
MIKKYDIDTIDTDKKPDFGTRDRGSAGDEAGPAGKKLNGGGNSFPSREVRARSRSNHGRGEEPQKRVFRIFLIVIILVLSFLIVVKLKAVMGNLVAVPVKRVQIYGTTLIQDKEILKGIGLENEVSLLFFNKKTARQKLLLDNRISMVEMAKIYPDTLRVYVAEKKKKFLLKAEDRSYWITADGVVLSGHSGQADHTYPVITLSSYSDDIKYGENIRNFMFQSLLQAAAEYGKKQPENANFFRFFTVTKGGIYLYSHEPQVRIFLGSRVTAEKLEGARALLLVLKDSPPAGLSSESYLDVDFSFSQAAVKVRGE